MKRHALIAAAALGLFAPALAQDIPSEPTQTLHATGAYPIRQDASQWLGSNLIGAKVVSASDESIGHVANLIVNDDGAVEAAVVSVGGLLGIGRKDVAVTFKSLNITRNKSGDAIDHVTLAATKRDLMQAPSFRSLSQQKVAEKR